MSEIETDFDKVAKQINAKLAEAAEAINEANRLSETINLPGLIFTQFVRDDYHYEGVVSDDPDEADAQMDIEIDALEEKFEKIKVGALESALEQGGWSTSSSYC